MKVAIWQNPDLSDVALHYSPLLLFVHLLQLFLNLILFAIVLQFQFVFTMILLLFVLYQIAVVL